MGKLNLNWNGVADTWPILGWTVYPHWLHRSVSSEWCLPFCHPHKGQVSVWCWLPNKWTPYTAIGIKEKGGDAQSRLQHGREALIQS